MTSRLVKYFSGLSCIIPTCWNLERKTFLTNSCDYSYYQIYQCDFHSENRLNNAKEISQ